MPRNSERSFCCGGGGARMWMEETIGSRINTNRTEEAVATGADQIAVGCPFCRVMLSDGLTAQQAEGKAREEVEVLDVAQMLLASVKRDADPKVTEAEPDAEDQADPTSISATAVAAPAADAAASGAAEQKAPDELDEPASEGPAADQEVAAKHNVALDEDGGGHEMSDADSADEPMAGEDLPAVEEVPQPEPEPEPADVPGTPSPDETEPEPAESGPDETGPVEEESREEEADTVPFSDPQPSSQDVSDTATELGSDDDAPKS
jgi:hypothetical protein